MSPTHEGVGGGGVEERSLMDTDSLETVSHGGPILSREVFSSTVSVITHTETEIVECGEVCQRTLLEYSGRSGTRVELYSYIYLSSEVSVFPKVSTISRTSRFSSVPQNDSQIMSVVRSVYYRRISDSRFRMIVMCASASTPIIEQRRSLVYMFSLVPFAFPFSILSHE